MPDIDQVEVDKGVSLVCNVDSIPSSINLMLTFDSDPFENSDLNISQEPSPAQSHVSGSETRSILSKLKVVVINCQSVSSKKSCYNDLVDYYDPHIVFGTESWLRPEICNFVLRCVFISSSFIFLLYH